MNIQQFASTPKLIEIVLDDEDLIETYGEPITFYTYDVVSLSTYFEFFNSRSNSQFEALEKVIKKLILLEDGKPAVKENQDLPIDIAAAAIRKVGDILGKSLSKTSMKTTGELQA